MQSYKNVLSMEYEESGALERHKMTGRLPFNSFAGTLHVNPISRCGVYSVSIVANMLPDNMAKKSLNFIRKIASIEVYEFVDHWIFSPLFPLSCSLMNDGLSIGLSILYFCKSFQRFLRFAEMQREVNRNGERGAEKVKGLISFYVIFLQYFSLIINGW